MNEKIVNNSSLILSKYLPFVKIKSYSVTFSYENHKIEFHIKLIFFEINIIE